MYNTHLYMYTDQICIDVQQKSAETDYSQVKQICNTLANEWNTVLVKGGGQ